MDAGAKYKSNTFVFISDAQPFIDRLTGGEKVNIKKEFQFYGTPNKLADELVEMADIHDGDCVLEPSAAQGAIIKSIYKYQSRIMLSSNDKPCTTIDYCELMDDNNKVLSGIIDKSRTSFIGSDFFKLEVKSPYMYHRIIANPPFSKNQDIDHIKKMYKHLLKGGRLVTIASNHWRNSMNKKECEFRYWIKKVKAKVSEIEAGAFKKSGTMTSSCIIVIDKK